MQFLLCVLLLLFSKMFSLSGNLFSDNALKPRQAYHNDAKIAGFCFIKFDSGLHIAYILLKGIIKAARKRRIH